LYKGLNIRKYCKDHCDTGKTQLPTSVVVTATKQCCLLYAQNAPMDGLKNFPRGWYRIPVWKAATLSWRYHSTASGGALLDAGSQCIKTLLA